MHVVVMQHSGYSGTVMQYFRSFYFCKFCAPHQELVIYLLTIETLNMFL